MFVYKFSLRFLNGKKKQHVINLIYFYLSCVIFVQNIHITAPLTILQNLIYLHQELQS